jgi:hypothetical protein
MLLKKEKKIKKRMMVLLSGLDPVQYWATRTIKTMNMKKSNECSKFGLKWIKAGFFDAFMSMFQLVSTIIVLGQHKLNISSVASDMDLIAPNFFNDPCKSPHTDAPWITGIRASYNLSVPLPLLLASDLPKIPFTPPQRLFRWTVY